MKKLKIPKPKYMVTDANWILKDLFILFERRKRFGEKLTLYGAYKKIRQMESYGALGDYIILGNYTLITGKI